MRYSQILAVRAATISAALCVCAGNLYANEADIVPVPLKPVVDADKRSCATKTSSGLGYLILKKGGEIKAKESDVALVNYVGYLASSGVVFDQNVNAVFAVDGVIDGFSEGLKQMGKGAIQRICVPAKLGYGDKPTGNIPANSDLVFQVELIDFIDKDKLRKEAQAAGQAEKANNAKAAENAEELAADAAEAAGK